MIRKTLLGSNLELQLLSLEPRVGEKVARPAKKGTMPASAVAAPHPCPFVERRNRRVLGPSGCAIGEVAAHFGAQEHAMPPPEWTRFLQTDLAASPPPPPPSSAAAALPAKLLASAESLLTKGGRLPELVLADAQLGDSHVDLRLKAGMGLVFRPEDLLPSIWKVGLRRKGFNGRLKIL